MNLFASLRSLFRKKSLDADMAEEMRQHIALQTQVHRSAGMSPEEAHYAAQRQFGGVEQLKEVAREARGLRWLDESVRDLRLTVRQLAKSPGFTAIVVLILGLGIGATTAIFSAVNALMLRSLLVKAPEELVAVEMPMPFIRAGGAEPASWRLFEEFRERTRLVSDMFVSAGPRTRPLVADSAAPDFVKVDQVTGNFFTALGVLPAAGRVLLPTDDRSDQPQAVAVISHAFWRKRFGSDPSVVGKSVLIERAMFTIVGVAAERFFGVTVGSNVEVWCPIRSTRLLDPEREAPEENDWMGVARGRLRAGVERETARRELDAIFQQDLARRAEGRNLNNPEVRRYHVGRTLELQPAGTGRGFGGDLHDQFQKPLLVLTAAAFVVLLVACANVAGLLLVRGAAREREFAVRAALGAGRARLIRQLLSESIFLASLGGMSGMGLAYGGTALLARYLPENNFLEFAPDGRVLLVALATTTVCGIFCGLIPAWRFSHTDLNGAMKSSGGQVMSGVGQTWNRCLVVLQVALSCGLLAAAGILGRSLHKLRTFDAGFARDHLVTFTLDPGKEYAGRRGIPLYREVLERLQALPGVRGATLSAQMPLVSGGAGTRFKVPGYVPEPGEVPVAHFLEIGPRFFETLGLTLLRGRGFNDADGAAGAPPVAIMGESMARHFFGADHAVGRHFTWGAQSVEIVGISRDLPSYEWPREKSHFSFYRPYVALDEQQHQVRFQIRTMGDPEIQISTIRKLIGKLQPAARVTELRTLEAAIDALLVNERAIADFSGFFGLFAVGLAGLGLYGLLAFGVVRRTREIGLRLALGAQPRDIVASILRQGIGLTLLGTALGLLAAAGATRLIGSFLFEVTPTNPVALGVGALLMVAVAAFACVIPAWRAAKVDPVNALRSE